MVEWSIDDPFEITLPSVYNNIPVEELGGYFGRGVPSPFYVSTSIQTMFPNANEYYATNEEYLYDEDLGWWGSKEVHTYKFIKTLSDNLKDVAFINSSIEVAEFTDEEGKILAKVFRPTYYFIISSNNKYFYTENGYLYKKDGTLVDNFVYYDA